MFGFQPAKIAKKVKEQAHKTEININIRKVMRKKRCHLS